MKSKSKKIMCAVSFVLSIAWIVILKTVDVGAIGPKGSKVGLSLINSSFHDLWHYDDGIGYNKFWYDISKYSGYLALGIVGLLGLFGLFQLIKRRNLFKVDHCILAAGVLYIVTGCMYVFFEFVIINYRPLIMPDEKELEASFPSSHTVLTIVVLGSLILLAKNYIEKKSARMILQFATLLILIAAVLGRIICGVHWFSDLIGGMLISMFLLSAFSIFNKKKLGKKDEDDIYNIEA